ncbi:hypothetical protein V496_00095 [Pseudogymnoascus sp. VKM F-4515 (FW-2607)]|nr:hypothetical protein V496_00095 [Pseudogymnoascus sp. VKM F-4515 (FW-2607)]
MKSSRTVLSVVSWKTGQRERHPVYTLVISDIAAHAGMEKPEMESHHGAPSFWLPSGEDDELWKCAKEKAKEATRQGKEPQTPIPRAGSTTLSVARAKRGTTSSLPDKVGKFSKRVDTALPGKHTTVI